MRLEKPVGMAVVMLLAVPSAGAGEWDALHPDSDPSLRILDEVGGTPVVIGALNGLYFN